MQKMKAYQIIIFLGLKLEYFSIHSYIVIPSVLLLHHNLALFVQYVAMSHSTEMRLIRIEIRCKYKMHTC